MRVVWIITLLLLLAGCGASSKRPNPAVTPPAYSLTANQLLAEFAANRSRAEDKFLEEVIEVRGAVKTVSEDLYGHSILQLAGGASYEGVRCMVDRSQTSELELARRDGVATVRGYVASYDDVLVNLTGCVILYEVKGKPLMLPRR